MSHIRMLLYTADTHFMPVVMREGIVLIVAQWFDLLFAGQTSLFAICSHIP